MELRGGCDIKEQVMGLFQDIATTLALIVMSNRKLAGNSHEVIEAMSPELQENKHLCIGSHDHTIKTLGLNWLPKTDTFYFNRTQNQCNYIISYYGSASNTKKQLLSVHQSSLTSFTNGIFHN